MTKYRFLFLLIGAFLLTDAALGGDVLLSISFENGALDPRLTVTNKGTFTVGPGIQSLSAFGDTKAFGFGRSTVPGFANWDYVSALTVSFDRPTYVSSIAFQDIELFGDLGSEGQVLADGRPVGDFGRTNNSRVPDTTYRTNLVPVATPVTNVTILVYDITQESEIFIDHLVISGSAMGISEQPQNQQIPFGGTARFSVTATNSLTNQVYRYQWYFNDHPIAGAIQSAFEITNAIGFYIGAYKVAVSDDYQTVMSDSAQLGVFPFAVGIFTAVEIEFPSQVGRNYQVVTSTNLVDWSKLGDLIPGTGQLIQRLYRSRDGAKMYYQVEEQ